jgi:DNA-binding MarR family transcriptional regulator
MADEEFEPTGLAPSYGFVLMTVNKKHGITAGEIANIMMLQPSTVTRLVDKLEEEGYLRREMDGKFMQVFPTAKGTRLDESLKSAWQKLYKRYSLLLGEQPSRELTNDIYEATITLEAD